MLYGLIRANELGYFINNLLYASILLYLFIIILYIQLSYKKKHLPHYEHCSNRKRNPTSSIWNWKHSWCGSSQTLWWHCAAICGSTAKLISLRCGRGRQHSWQKDGQPRQTNARQLDRQTDSSPAGRDGEATEEGERCGGGEGRGEVGWEREL